MPTIHTKTTELSAVIQTYIERTVWPLLSYNVVFDQYARLIPLPSGNTVRVPRITPLSVIKSELPEASTTFSAQSIIPNYVEKAIEIYGAYTDISKKAKASSLVDAVRTARMQLEQQAARSINRRYALAVSSQNGMRWRRVADTGSSTLLNKSVTSMASTTSMVVDVLLGDKDPVGGAQVFFRTGKNAGLGRRVKTATSSSSTITLLTAFPQAGAAGDTVDIVQTLAISTTTTYRLSLQDVFVAAELARRSGAQGFSPGSRVNMDSFGISRNVGGMVPQLAFFVDSQVALDLMVDAATNGYSDVFKQTSEGFGRWSKGQFGLINNVSFVMHNEGYRMTAATASAAGGAESDTGVVHAPTIIGANSYFSTKFRGMGNERAGLQFRVKVPGTQTINSNDPHDLIIARVVWDAWHGVATQNGFHGTVMLCGASTDA